MEPHRRTDQDGFSLFELAWALAILVLGFMGLFLAIGQATQLGTGTDLRNLAAVETERLLEDLQASSVADALAQYDPQPTVVEGETWYRSEAPFSQGSAGLLKLEGVPDNRIEVFFLTESQAADELEQANADLDGDGDLDTGPPASTWNGLAVLVRIDWTEGSAAGPVTRTHSQVAVIYDVAE